MDESKLKIIMSLTGNFARVSASGAAISNDPWTADCVDGKGNGLIFLLHGGPGWARLLQQVRPSKQRPHLFYNIND